MKIDGAVSIHDFRVVFGETHTNLIFDMVVPFNCKDVGALCDKVQNLVWEINPSLFTVITTEHSYT